MSVFLAYGLSQKNKRVFISLSFLFSISIILLMFFNNSSLSLYNSSQTLNPIAVYLSYFALSCVVYLFFNLLSVWKDYRLYKANFFFPHSKNMNDLLTQKAKLLQRIIVLKKIYHSVITPSESFLGNLEKNKRQLAFVSKKIGSREHAKKQYKNLIRLENKLQGDKPMLKSDSYALFHLAFFHEYNQLIKLFSLK